MTVSPPRPSPRRPAAALAVVAAVLLMTAGAGSSAGAAEAADAWGPQGMVSTSDSAVTVHWDDADAAGGPATSVVYRDERQALAGTLAKTYADLSPELNAAYENAFGAANGVVGADGTPGLQMSVSQTGNLVNQAVDVTISGVDLPNSSVYLFQCWGASGETSPDPTRCASYAQNGAIKNSIDANDMPLVVPDPEPSVGGAVELTGIDGSTVGTLVPSLSNGVALRLSGSSTSLAFVVLTGQESNFLGCGVRADGTPSTDTCWLVAVPFNQALVQDTSALVTPGTTSVLTPSLWGQRMQVRLGMAPVDDGCPDGQARTLVGGSELVSTAMQYWAPGLCTGRDIALGYQKIGDPQARDQYAAGAQNVILTTQPVTGSTSTVYAPVALTGLTIAYVADATQPGEPRGQQVTDLRLNARLVAKLLTQSYQVSIDGSGGAEWPTKAPWVADLPVTFGADPELQALNPDLGRLGGDMSSAGDILVTSTRADALAQLWRWILADHDARAFLDGCPDPYGEPYGMTVNPFLSTRSYAECPQLRDELDAVAQARIDATDSPDTFAYEPMTYPPDGTPFPQPGWYARDAQYDLDGAMSRTPLTLNDIHPRVATLADAGRAGATVNYPSNTIWCPAATDSTCINGTDPGKWKSAPPGQVMGARGIFVLTDAGTAAKFQMPTARLCPDDSGDHCVGADTASLRTAAAGFVDSGTLGVSLPPDVPDYAAGAYPLAMPVYAAVQTKGLSSQDAATIAGTIGYLTTTGQKPGTSFGDLAPGYAPLTEAMVAQAAAAVHTLLNPPEPPGEQPTDEPSEPPADDPDGQAPVVPVTRPVPSPSAPARAPVPAPTTPAPSPSPSRTSEPEAGARGAATPATPLALPRYGLVGGLVGGAASLIAAPVLGSKRKLRGR